MAFFKRIFLFIAVNFLVVLTISLTLQIFGIRGYVSQYGIDYGSLLAFCAVVGFVGSLVSLLLSRFMAKFMMGVRVINPQNPASYVERDLLNTVYRLAEKAGLPKMPEVGIYESPEVNAFATGPTKSRALVAVSSGLLNQMDAAAVEGVLGHEVAHVANGDMVTMALVQGIVNTFVLFFARIFAWGLAQAFASKDDRDGGASPFLQYVFIFIFEILFSLLGAIVVAYYSRMREYRADKGSANLTSKEKMIHALQSLKRGTDIVDEAHPSIAAFKINGKKGGFLSLFSSHPDLDLRIEALKNYRH